MNAIVAWSAADSAAWLTPPRDSDDKYSRGVVGFATGSRAYPGAAVLGVEAAVHAGVGMVRYVGPDEVGALVLQRRPEVVLGAGRAHAWVVGSGTPSGPEPGHLPSDASAFILDAGAIGTVGADLAPTIITPHAGELARLLGIDRDAVDADPVGAARRAADALGAVVLLKGATTYAVHGGHVVSVRAGTPWLATAGTGDALAGVLGALVATRAARGPVTLESLVRLGATAAYLHGSAARIAARCEPDGSGGGPFSVLDLTRSLPEAIRRLR